MGKDQYGIDPMEQIRKLFGDSDVAYAEPEQTSNGAWSAFMDLRNNCPSEEERKVQGIVSKYTSDLAAAKRTWKTAAWEEIKALLNSAKPTTTFTTEGAKKQAIQEFNAKVTKAMKPYVAALVKLQALALKAIQDDPSGFNGAATAIVVSKMLNRANIFLVLFHQVLKTLGSGKQLQKAFDLKENNLN